MVAPLLDASLDIVELSRLDHERQHLRVQGFYAYCREAFVSVAGNGDYLRARPRDVREAIALACRIHGELSAAHEGGDCGVAEKYVPGDGGQVLSFDEFVVAASSSARASSASRAAATPRWPWRRRRSWAPIDTSNVRSNPTPRTTPPRA